MAINWGAVTNTSGAYSGTPVSAGAITTSASGSSFYVVAIAFGSGLTFTVTDNKSNSYSVQGGVASNTSDGISMGGYLCINGTGGASHVVSVAASANTGTLIFYVIEITGGDLTGSAVDAVFSTSSGFLGNPTTQTLTTTNAADLILSVMQNNSTTVTAFTQGSGFTNISQRLADGSVLVGQVVSATGTYSPAIGWSPSGGRNQMTIIAIKAAGSGGQTLTAATGTFALAGQAAPLRVGMPLGVGTFSLTGQNATLTPASNNQVLVAATGAFNLTGALSQTDTTILAANGPFTLAGQSANLNANTGGGGSNKGSLALLGVGS